MSDVGRILIILGITLVVIGGVIMLFGRAGFPLGRLPGDIVYKGRNSAFYFPLTTSILLSLVLSAVLYLISRFRG